MEHFRFFKLLVFFAILNVFLKFTSADDDYKVVCYYGSWANYRHGDGTFQVEDTDPTLCTHFIYTFTGLDASTFEMKSLDPYLNLPDNRGLNAFGRAVQLKNINPNLKVILAVGGWNEGSFKYSEMAADAGRRNTFINSVMNFVETYNFDGFDVDWEYPSNRGGAVVDKQNIIFLLEELKERLHAVGKILTIAVGMGVDKFLSGYDAKKISDAVDMINMMTYDFTGHFDGKTGHHTQMFQGPNDEGENAYYNLNSSVHLWLNNGADPKKLILGMAMYGQTFQVAASSNGDLGVPSTGPGQAGQFTQQAGFIGYNEFCVKLKTENWFKKTNDYVLAPWAYKDDQFVAYDSIDSIRYKSEWGKNLGLGGGMIWSLETDDFHGTCGDGKFPLLSTINSIWRSDQIISPPATSKPTLNPENTTNDPLNPTNNHQSTSKKPTVKATTPKPVEPTTPNPLYKTCEGNSFMADPNDCSKYYQCAPTANGEGTWIHQSCPSTLYYSETNSICDYESQVNCGSRTITSKIKMRKKLHPYIQL